MLKAIVLAGGFGTRLSHITKDVPKPMAPVNDAPFLKYVLDHLIDNGITDISLAVLYKWEIIESYFSDSYRGAKLNYIVEEEPLGTGGAILNAIANWQDTYIVVNGDTLFPVDIVNMYEVFRSSKTSLMLAAKHMDKTGRYGRVEFDEESRVLTFVEKGEDVPGVINGGIYILSPEIFSSFKLGQRFSFEDEVLTKSLNKNNTKVFISDEYFIDIGIPEDYARAQKEVS